MPYEDKDKQKAYQQRYYKKYKQAYLKRTNDRKKELQKWFLEYKSKLKCSQCGENHIACLDFHHLDPTKKEDGVGSMATGGKSKKKILEEIAKCIVLCSNCHRKLHFNDPKFG